MKHDQEQPADAIAERLDHLAVLDPGAHQQADLGVLENVPHGEEQRQADADGDQPVFLDGSLADDDRALQRFGPRQMDLVRPQTT
jgi:hypothetical protein